MHRIRQALAALAAFLGGEPITPPLHCPRCHWTQSRVSRSCLTVVQAGYVMRCPWDAQPMIRSAQCP